MRACMLVLGVSTPMFSFKTAWNMNAKVFGNNLRPLRKKSTATTNHISHILPTPDSFTVPALFTPPSLIYTPQPIPCSQSASLRLLISIHPSHKSTRNKKILTENPLNPATATSSAAVQQK